MKVVTILTFLAFLNIAATCTHRHDGGEHHRSESHKKGSHSQGND